MKTLAEQFREIRRVATPWCIVQTTDYRETIRTLLAVRINGEEPPGVCVWDCANGPRTIQGEVDSLGSDTDPPSEILKAAKRMPAESILFFVVPDDRSLPGDTWSNPFTTQAAANLRDEFKSDRRTLVILSSDGKLPPLLADDVPVLVDPLPTRNEISGIIGSYIRGQSEQVKLDFTIPEADLAKSVDLCRGMTRFAVEDHFSRRFSRKRKGIDLGDLALAQRTVIEQSSDRGLVFERGSETFTDIGGLETIKTFSRRLFQGKNPPTVIVRIEEIEKAMAGSGSAFGDTSGVSQDQLGILLDRMEANNWAGFVAVGPAGSGKSLISKAMGNTYGIPSVNLDLGALKGQYVGQSEAKIRKAMDLLYSFAEQGAYFIATSNRLDVIPPELRRRFRFGVWYFDLPTNEERRSIWTINLNRFSIPAQEMPNHEGWTGSDIRNCCDLAYRLDCPLTEAANYLVPVARSNPDAVAKLRDSAHGKFLSASQPGPYLKPEKSANRAVAI